jgi:hypothetical protein
LTGAGDLVNAAPVLGGLAANGGPTETVALLPGSPAIDAGDPAGCTNALEEPLAVDQRGVTRPQGARCDIGAYELVQLPAPPAGSAPGKPPPIPAPVPALSGLRITPSSFRAARSGPTIAAAHNTPKGGAKITYSDTLPATTSFAILRSTAGVRSGGKCVAPRHGRHYKRGRCTRLISVTTFSHLDRAGANSLRFSGRVHGRKLARGQYTLRATPVLSGRVGLSVSTRFKITG